MDRYKIFIKEIFDMPQGPVFIHSESIDIMNIEDKNEVTKKIEEINIATNNHYSNDVKMVEFTVSRDDKPIWMGKGSIINRDQDTVANRLIKVEELIEK